MAAGLIGARGPSARVAVAFAGAWAAPVTARSNED